MNMNVTLKLKLHCSEGVYRTLTETIRQCTGTFNRACKFGFENRTANSITIHKSNYESERSQTQLPSQLICGTFSKAGEALRSRLALQRKYDAKVKENATRLKPKAFRCPQSACQSVRYDGKRASVVRIKEGWANLSSIAGRQQVKFSLPRNFNRYTEWKVCCSELVLDRRNRLFLHVVLDGDGKPFVPNGFVVGIDLGIKRPAVMSTKDGSFNRFIGKKEWKAIEDRRRSYVRTLQRKGTKPAKRKLKLLSGKVNRFRKDCDHQLSRQLVDSVPAGAVLVFENLKDIVSRCGKGKGRIQNGRMHRWSFARLFEFVDYKARLSGVGVAKVDPRNTSRRCSKCGHVDRGNRKDQSRFECKSCHNSLNADLNGARNVALKYLASCDMSHEAGRLSTGPMSPDS